MFPPLIQRLAEASPRPARLALWLLLLLLLAANGIPHGSAAAAEGEGPRVQELLQARLTVLKEIARAAEVEAEAVGGVEAFRRACEAKLQVAFAELELAESEERRIALLEGAVATAREFERVVTAMHEAGLARPLDLQRARLLRLDHEIALQRRRRGG